jgi:hypothetical protein
MAIEIPVEAQQILDANDPRFQGANATPVQPGTNMPLAPPQQQVAPAAPEIGSTIAPGSLADKISAAFLQHLAQRQPPPPPSTQAAQSRGARVAQGVGGALTSVSNAIGNVASDASHSGDKPGGFLTGVENVMAARSARIAGTKQRDFENKQEAAKNDALIARNQAETIQLVRNIHRQDQEARTASYAQGKTFVDSLRADHNVTDNVNHDQLYDMIQKNPGYLQSHYVRPVGEEPVLDGSGNPKVDPNGDAVMSPMYSLVDRATISGGSNAHKVTPEEADYFKKNLGKDYPIDTPLTIDQYTALAGQAHKAADTTAMINKDRADALTSAQRDQLRTDLNDDQIQHYVAMVPGSALGGLYAASKNADDHIKVTQQQIQLAQQKGDANAVQQLQGKLKTFQGESAKVNRVITNAFSDKDRDTYQKDIEKEHHDRAEEAEKLRAERDRNEGKVKQKQYDQAHDVWNDAKAKNNQDDDEAAAYLLRTNPKALATLQDEENRNAVVTEREDPLTGTTTRTTKGKANTFTDLINNNRQAAAAVTHLDTVNDTTQRWQQIMSSTQLSTPMKIRLLKHYNYSVPRELTAAR